MPITLRLVRVDFAYRESVSILSGVSLDLGPGWTAVVGPNGGGKTTLLRLLAGELRPGAGAIERHPPSALVHLCHQRVDDAGGGLADLAASWERAAIRLRARLDLEPKTLQRWATLSPGQRKRWQIGAALHARPDALLLDEPTNHLDAEARARLVNALSRYRGTGVLVSHDRALIDELATTTVRVEAGRASVHAGGYAEASAAWQAERREAERQASRARDRARAARRHLAEVRRDHASARGQTSSRRRMKHAGDSDGRSVARKFRAERAEATLGRQSGVARREAERAAAAAAAHRPARRRGRSLFVDDERAPVAQLVALERPVIHAGDHPVLREVRVVLRRGARVHLRGANGVGKTTLVNALLDAAGPRAERMLYLPQELPAADEAAALAALAAADATRRARILDIVAALGVGPDRLLASARPSPGELRKLALATGLARGVWALMLDEPTNHLDLPSIERLEQALADYPGALLLVTHDPALAAALTDEVWAIEDGCVVVNPPAESRTA